MAAEPLTKAEIRALVGSLRLILATLAGADPAAKANIYADLGIEITYEPGTREVVATVAPAGWATERVGGASWPLGTWTIVRRNRPHQVNSPGKVVSSATPE